MKKIILGIVLVGIFAILWGGYSEIKQQDLQSRLSAAESRIEYLESLELRRSENDMLIFVSDPDGFIVNNGLGFSVAPISIDSARVVDSVGKEIGAGYTYKFDQSPALVVDDTGARFSLEVHKGQTLHFMKYTEGGVTQLAYYTCYTNSRSCYVDTQILPIALAY